MPYTPAIDMWSFACILTELLTGYPLFPGENEQEQIALMIELFGLPPMELLESGSRAKLFFDEDGRPLQSEHVRSPADKHGAKSLR